MPNLPSEIGVAGKKRENDGTLIPGRIRNLGSGGNGVAAHANVGTSPRGIPYGSMTRLDSQELADAPSLRTSDFMSSD